MDNSARLLSMLDRTISSGTLKKIRLYVNSWGKEKPIERKKQVVKNETERSEVEFSLPAFARWVIEICTEYENGSV